MTMMTMTTTTSSPLPLPSCKTILVTVGTTLFDKLIDGVTTPAALQWMQQQGYQKLVIQYGKGKRPQEVVVVAEEDDEIIMKNDDGLDFLQVCVYDFASSLEEDMQQADLIISHAGAGTVMEALKFQKKLVVVVNTDLMNNHQTELASAMHSRKLLWMVTSPEALPNAFAEFQDFVPLPHQEGDEFAFPLLLDSFLGFEGGHVDDDKKKA
jgi:beta-1,4-N-acetylglucosaminyltransferase